MRDIIEKDILPIKKLLKDVLGIDSFEKIERMGGLTNHTYHITLSDGEGYVLH